MLAHNIRVLAFQAYVYLKQVCLRLAYAAMFVNFFLLHIIFLSCVEVQKSCHCHKKVERVSSALFCWKPLNQHLQWNVLTPRHNENVINIKEFFSLKCTFRFSRGRLFHGISHQIKLRVQSAFNVSLHSVPMSKTNNKQMNGNRNKIDPLLSPIKLCFSLFCSVKRNTK